jgi:hypothetical protein
VQSALRSPGLPRGPSRRRRARGLDKFHVHIRCFGVVAVAAELDLELHLLIDHGQAAHGAPTPGPPQLRSGARLGILPPSTAARAFGRSCSSGIWRYLDATAREPRRPSIKRLPRYVTGVPCTEQSRERDPIAFRRWNRLAREVHGAARIHDAPVFLGPQRSGCTASERVRAKAGRHRALGARTL